MTHSEEPHSDDDQHDDNIQRISPAAARKMLGMIGKNYSEQEILEILDGLYRIAEEGFEIFVDKNDASDDSKE